MAGKCVGETISLPEHRHVNVLNRGGLWKVNEDDIAIFNVAEAYYVDVPMLMIVYVNLEYKFYL